MKAFGTARLGSDMELRYMTDGTAVGSVSLAVRLGIKDKSSGEYKTQWINASLFGKRAESLAPMLTKGSLHAFHLRDLHIDEFTGKDGAIRTSMKATIDDVESCGKSQGEHAEPAARQDASPAAKPAAKGSFDDFDDDIPFMWHGAPGAGVSWRAI
jgi:single-strand DNA-binding protein